MRLRIVQIAFDKLRGKPTIQTYPPSTHYGEKFIYRGDAGNAVVYERLRQGAPCLIARLGETESRALMWFMKYMHRDTVVFNPYIKKPMYRNAGFFNNDDVSLTRFCCEMLGIARNIDILGAWFVHNEKILCQEYLPHDSKVVSLACFYPVHDFASPLVWTRHLAGKKVLVIHPFVDSIRRQYEKRSLLFANEHILPEFDLITMKAYQSIAGNNPDNHASWFDALEAMQQRIAGIDFDIALIGAGAYGLFLGDYCKRLGKQAVHMGGALQILFGIMGKRWDANAKIPHNEQWIRPLEHETPRGFTEVERGCYW